MLMAVFAYLYFHYYVAQDGSEMELLDHLLELGKFAKLRVFVKVGEMLVAEGLLPGEAFISLLNETATGMQSYADLAER